MVQFCGMVATYQYERKCYFIIENPETSQMWNTEPMLQLLAMKDVKRTTIHLCAYGLVDPVSGWAMKKPISLLHNMPMSIVHRLIRRCDGKHEHQRISGSSPGHGSRAVLSQAYPWQFCTRLAGVIQAVLKAAQNDVRVCMPAVVEECKDETWSDWWEDMASSTKCEKPRMGHGSAVEVPAMPCATVEHEHEHQDRQTINPFVHYAMVARAVNKQESATTPKAIEAMKAE